jgi:hypothetical protein
MSSSQNETSSGPPTGRWLTSSHSGGNNECVEMFFLAEPAPAGPAVLIRDSKDPEGGTFSLPANGWKGLVASVQSR